MIYFENPTGDAEHGDFGDDLGDGDDDDDDGDFESHVV